MPISKTFIHTADAALTGLHPLIKGDQCLAHGLDKRSGSSQSFCTRKNDRCSIRRFGQCGIKESKACICYFFAEGGVGVGGVGGVGGGGGGGVGGVGGVGGGGGVGVGGGGGVGGVGVGAVGVGGGEFRHIRHLVSENDNVAQPLINHNFIIRRATHCTKQIRHQLLALTVTQIVVQPDQRPAYRHANAGRTVCNLRLTIQVSNHIHSAALAGLRCVGVATGKQFDGLDDVEDGLHDDSGLWLKMASGPLCYIDGSHTVQLHKGATHGILGFDTCQLASGRVSSIAIGKNWRGDNDTGMRWHQAPRDSCDKLEYIDAAWLCCNDSHTRPWLGEPTCPRATRSCGVSPACCAAYPDCQPAERSAAKAAFLSALSFSSVVRGPVFTVLRISDRLLGSGGEFGCAVHVIKREVELFSLGERYQSASSIRRHRLALLVVADVGLSTSDAFRKYRLGDSEAFANGFYVIHAAILAALVHNVNSGACLLK